jgi:hypothetical protein
MIPGQFDYVRPGSHPDPRSGVRTVDPAHARHLAEHEDRIIAFCSIGCRTRFVRETSGAWLTGASPAPSVGDPPIQAG